MTSKWRRRPRFIHSSYVHCCNSEDFRCLTLCYITSFMFCFHVSNIQHLTHLVKLFFIAALLLYVNYCKRE